MAPAVRENSSLGVVTSGQAAMITFSYRRSLFSQISIIGITQIDHLSGFDQYDGQTGFPNRTLWRARQEKLSISRFHLESKDPSLAMQSN